MSSATDNETRKAFCQWHGLEYRVFSDERLKGFPEPDADAPSRPGRKKSRRHRFL